MNHSNRDANATTSQINAIQGGAHYGVRTGLVRLALAMVVAVLAWIPMQRDLDALVTPDEPLWVMRSANFYQALSSGDFEHTAQAAHPGVTTMWLGTIALWLRDDDIPDRMQGQITQEEIRERLVEPGQTPSDLLVEMRRPVILTNSTLLALLFLALAPLVGSAVAFGATVLLAWNPLLLGFGRLLHLDALSALLAITAMVAWIGWLRMRSWSYLVLAGIMLGLATLTRTANGYVALAIVVVSFLPGIIPARRESVARRIGHVVLVGAVAFGTVVLLWPALWTAPVDTIDLVLESSTELVSSAHQRAVLYRGEITTDDPGPLYYLIAFWLRITPLALAGIGILIGGAFLNRFGKALRIPWFMVFGLLVLVAGNAIVLVASAKKLDRYLLPSLLALELMAGLALVLAVLALARRIARRQAGFSVLAGGLIAILLIARLWTSQTVAPYFITSVSPLAGGADQREMSLGWGEGGKTIAEAIAQDPVLMSSTLRGGAWPTTIDWHLPVQIAEPVYQATRDAVPAFLATDFLIVDHNEIDRGLYEPAISEWISSQTPYLEITEDGKWIASIYDLRGVPVPDAFVSESNQMLTWDDGGVRMMAAQWLAEVPIDTFQRVRLTFEVAGPSYYWVKVVFTDPDGAEVASTERRLRTEESGQTVIRLVFDQDVVGWDPDLTYSIHIELRTDDTGEVLDSTNLFTGRGSSEPLLGTFQLVPVETDPGTPEASTTTGIRTAF